MMNGFPGKLKQIADSPWFQNGVLGLIFLAAVLVGLETSRSLMDRHGDLLHTLDKIVLWLFVLEALIKMGQHGKKFYRYFQDPWNVFDFIIIAVCFLPFGGPYAAVLRLARVLRALRLVTAIPKLQLLVSSLLRSLPSMVWVGILLGLLFYIYAVLGVFLFRDNDPVHFKDLATSALSLFRIVTLEDWTDIMYIQMYGSDVYAYRNTTGLPTEPKAMPIVGSLFFVSFVMLGTMVILNLFIGVIVNSMDEAQAEEERKERQRHIAETGSATVGDELAELQHQLEVLGRRVQTLRKQQAAEEQ